MDSGKLIWERRWNVYHSDVPPHRAAWSSPSVDHETGNIFVFGVNGDLHALSSEGKTLWEHSLVEEFGIVTTHGGRTASSLDASHINWSILGFQGAFSSPVV